ncbi:MAG TPA: hypothetical protein VEX18_03025 [Polyangiaceae bacterium]|nr:hypothetical protein [Polyangiaceae bacterium]
MPPGQLGTAAVGVVLAGGAAGAVLALAVATLAAGAALGDRAGDG